jgi:hypothetical protein
MEAQNSSTMATDLDLVLSKSHYAIFCTITLVTLFFLRYSLLDHGAKYPILNPKKTFEFSNGRVVHEFIQNSRDLFAKARALYKNQPYKAYTDWGEIIVIPPQYIEDLKSHPKLDFHRVSQDVIVDLLPVCRNFIANLG